MNRRTFFGLIAAVLSVLPGRAKSPSYFYNWNTGETDDPQFSDRGYLPYGDCNQVILDGEDVSLLYIVEVRTGPQGYIRYQLRDENNQPRVDYDHGCLCLETRYGNVEYNYHPEVERRQLEELARLDTTTIANKKWRTYIPKLPG